MTPFEPRLITSNPAFQHLRPFWNCTENWPTRADLSAGCVVQFVAPNDQKNVFLDHYEVRIAERKEVETRQECWHDLCNALIWNAYPKSKWALNQRYYKSLCRRKETWTRSARRSPEEDLCTVINENALIIAYLDEQDKKMIQSFLWHDFFWKNRDGLAERMELFFWGHSLLEKSMQPYIGMTGHGIFIPVTKTFFSIPVQQKIEYVDSALHTLLIEQTISSVQDLSPFPILGFPGFCDEAEEESFYDNKGYFRTGRSGTKKVKNFL